MSKHVKVSVIMGVYNDERYLKDAIDSVLNQTFQEFEFIIIDDGSTDRSIEITKKIAEKDKRIRFYQNERNIGLASTLNKAIELSNADYIARMDSDDICVKERLAIQVAVLDSNPNISVVGGSAIYIDANSNKQNNFRMNIGKVSLSDAVKRVPVIHPTVMMRKSPLEDVNGYTVNEYTRRAEDYDLWCKLLEKDYEIQNIDDVLLLYREDRDAFKKRKYRYRIQEYKIKKHWMKRTNQPLKIRIFSYRPLLVGLIPSGLMYRIKRS